MKIALAARGCRPGAGIELYTYELAGRLARKHEVAVITRPGEYQACGARLVPVIVRSWPKWHSILAFSQQAGRLARQGNYDIVHAQGSDCCWGEVATAHACHAAGMAASLRLHPGPANRARKALSPAHRVIVRLEQQVFGRAQRVLAVSRQVEQQLRAVYGLPADSVRTVYPGAALPRLTTRDRQRSGLGVREKLRVPQDAFLFLLAANAPRLKGAERILRAMSCGPGSGHHFLIASGSRTDPKLARLAQRLGLAGRVHFLDTGRDVLPAYSAADAYIALPEYESFGLAVLEAMLCGLPVIVTENAGAAELMHSGREGLLLPDLADDRLVAAAMQRLAADKALRQRLGAAARRKAVQYTWNKMAAEIERVYLEVLKMKGSSLRSGCKR